MTTTINVTWVQGQDLEFDMIYQEGADTESLVTKDLSSGYSIRMDIVDPDGNRLYTFNSANIPDVDPLTVGSQPDTNDEAVLSSGAGGTSNIAVSISRELTLPGGELYALISDVNPTLNFNSDVFLRNIGANKQWKILTLNITIEKSYTLWV